LYKLIKSGVFAKQRRGKEKMKKLFIVVTIVLALAVGNVAMAEQTLYGVRGSYGFPYPAYLITINHETGELADAPPTEPSDYRWIGMRGVGGLAINPLDGTMYAVGSGYTNAPGLHTLDPLTGEVTRVIGEFIASDMAFDSDGTLYAIIRADGGGPGYLATIDVDNGSTTAIGGHNFGGGIGVAFDCSGTLYIKERAGGMYGIDMYGIDLLHTVNKDTGIIETTVPLSARLRNSLAIDENNVLYSHAGLDWDDKVDQVVTIDPDTGEVTYLESVVGHRFRGWVGISALAFTPPSCAYTPADGDGIADLIDTSPEEYSNDFSDATETNGTITDRGDQVLTVKDEPDPYGVRITADPAGGDTPATVSACGGSSIVTLSPGDEVVVTCGSVTIEVIGGLVEITFVADDGTLATTSLVKGSSLVFEPTTFTITAPSSNTEDVAILVNGEEISLAAGGTASNMIVNIEKAKISWDHSDIKVDGKLYLPEGLWKDTLSPVGSAMITLADIGVTDQDVEFEIKGKKGDRWEYKDKENLNDNIKELKIDWKGAKFDYHGDDGFHIHTHFIGGTETTLCIHTGRVSGDFTVTINGSADENTIDYVYDAATKSFTIYTDIGYEAQKDDNTHVHFSLPFALTSDMKIEVNESMELTINVADHYKEGYAKFKLVSIFHSGFFPDGSGSSPDKLKCVITFGEYTNMILGNDLIGVEKGWTKKDDKHWEYKPKKPKK
jgi:hypothetical protein